MNEHKYGLKRKLEQSIVLFESEKNPKKQRIDTALKNLDISNLNAPSNKEAFEELIDDTLESVKSNYLISLSAVNTYLDDSHIVKLSKVLKENTSLMELDISRNDFGREGTLSLVDALYINTSLKTLHINHIPKNKSMKSIFPCLANNKTLSCLKISDQDVDDEDEFCGIGTQGMNSLVGIMLGNTTLMKLDLGRNNINKEAIVYLGEILKNNNTLKELSLCHNNIKDSDVIELCKCLHENTVLEKLDLSLNNITDIGANAIVGMLKINITLLEINLERNKWMSQEKYNEIEKIIFSRNRLRRTCQSLSVVMGHRNAFFSSNQFPPELTHKIMVMTEDLKGEFSESLIKKHLRLPM
jgi:hypothetical protein